MGCNVKLTDNIKLADQDKNSFSSEEEFDLWLFKNRTALTKALKMPKIDSATLLINTSPAESRKQAWEAFTQKMAAIAQDIGPGKVGDAHYGDKFGKIITMGTTTFFSVAGNKDDINKEVSKFDENEIIQRWKDEGKTDSEIREAINKRRKSGALVAIDGTVFGAIVEDILTNTDTNLNAIKSRAETDKGFKENLDTAGITISQAIERVKDLAEQRAQEIKKEIVRRHGSDINIFSEVEVFSKTMSSEMRAALSKASLLKKRSQSANVLKGYIDLVVQDANGELHSYDIKLSTYKVNDWWGGSNSNKKYDEISAQQMAYATMARQWGINFATIGIIPAWVEYDVNGNIKSITSEDFKNFSLTNPYAIACERYFPVHRKTDSETIRQLSNTTEELYPGLQLSTSIKSMEMNKDFVMRNIVGEKKAFDGKYHLKIDWDNSIIGKEFVTESKEEMEKFVVDNYIPQMNAKYAQELRGLAQSLRSIAKVNTGRDSKLEQLREMARGFSKDRDTQDWIINRFKKFVIQDGWDLVSDEDNLLADYGVFVFVRNGLAEVIMLDNADLYGLTELGKAKNTTVLGNLRHDLVEGMDDMTIMKSLRGNLLLMKAMAFISQNEGTLFDHIKIQAVRSMNLRWCQEIEESNDKLVKNWNILSGLYNIKNENDSSKTTLRTVSDSLFLSSGLAYVQRANDIAETFLDTQIHFKEHEHYLEVFADDSAEDILRYIRNLQSGSRINISNSDNWKTHSDEFEAYQLLLHAYLSVRGFILSAQNGVGDLISNGFFATGTRSSSPAESNSSALRLFNQIDSTYEQKLRDEFMKIVHPWQDQMLKVYEENGIDKVFGGDERKLFKYCFETDKDGNITPDFCLIPPDAPDHPYFAGRKHPELKKLVKMFLEQINELRIPDPSEREALSIQRNSIYYQVPLTEASFGHKVTQGGIKNAIVAWGQSVFDETKEFLYGKPMSNFEIKKFKSIDREQVYDPYLATSDKAQEFRRKQLSGESIIEPDENGKTKKRVYQVANFETSLDTIFLRSIASALRSRVSQEFMPLFTGLRCILAYNANIQGAELDSIQTAVDDFIKSAVFGKSLIKPEFQKLNQIIKLLKHITSMSALAINSVAFTREMLTSALRTSFNKSFDPLMKGQFSEKEYLDSMLDIILKSKDNVDVMSFYTQMNFAYGLANVSQEQIDHATKTGFLNFHNWEEDLLFMTSTSPDFVHRNAILCAVLKHRGSYDAYSLNEDKELVYDISKDKYYEVYWKYKDHYDKITDRKTKELFKQQEQNYLIALDDWNRRYGLNLQPGDALPHALSPTEANGIRVYADHMFGNYDASTKSLIQKGMLGSIIFQFKTYSINRFLQSFRDKGHINVTRQHTVKTDDGEEMWEVVNIPGTEDYATYGPRKFKKKSKLTDEELNRATPLILLTGTGTAGKAMVDFELGRDLILDRGRFMENWKNNEVYRGQLYISLIDNLGMLIIAMLLKLWYGEETVDDLYNQDWWTRWSYTVLMGVAQDGPIDQVVGGLVGNGTPPSLAIIKSFYKNMYNVVTGEDTALFGFMNSFGATRQFAGMFNNAR